MRKYLLLLLGVSLWIGGVHGAELTAGRVPVASDASHIIDGVMVDTGTAVGVGSTSPRGRLDVNGVIYGDGSGLTNLPISAGTVTAVTASFPLSSTGGTTPNITIDTSAYPRKTVSINTNFPLSGGGDLSSNRTLSIDLSPYLRSVAVYPGLLGNGTVGNPLQVDSTVYGAGGGTVTAVTASFPLSSSGGNTPNITIDLTPYLRTVAVYPGILGDGTVGNPIQVDASVYGPGVGTVTNVTATYPLASSGGATPNITVDTSAYAQKSTTISTTYPLGGGGNLTTNRTLTVDLSAYAKTADLGSYLTSVAVNPGLTGNGTSGNPLTVDTSVYARRGTLTNTKFCTSDGTSVICNTDTPSGASAANPTGTIILTAVNGSADTFLRSDGAPALSQAISPTWTGNHTFTPSSGNTLITAGNLGIGTTSARRMLDVEGSVYLEGNVGIGSVTPRALVEVGNAATIPAGSNPTAIFKGNLVVDGDLYGGGVGIVGIDAGGGDISGTLTANKVVKGTGAKTISTDTNIWTPGTNVGIGDSSPDGVLEIVKSGALKSLLVSSTATGDGDYLTVNSGGNIGIGTITPTWKVAVGSGATSLSPAPAYAANSMLIKGKLLVDGGIYSEFISSASGTSGFWSGTGSPVDIRNNNAGNVGIGILPSSEKLQVEGKIFLRDGGGNLSIGQNLGSNGEGSYNASVHPNWTPPTAITTGIYNSRFGSNCLSSVTSGNYNGCLGWNAGYYAGTNIDSYFIGSFTGTNQSYGARNYFIGHYTAQYLNNSGGAYLGTDGNLNTDNFYIGNEQTGYSQDEVNSFNVGNKVASAGSNALTLGGASTTKAVFHGGTLGLGSGTMNVGINARSPLAMLDVEGNVYIGKAGGGGNLGIGISAPTDSLHIYTGTTSAGTSTLTLESPDTSISNEVISTINFKGRDSAVRTGAQIKATATATWGTDVDQASTSLGFYTEADSATTTLTNPRFLITADGNIGIGSITPSANLDIDGGTYLQDAANGGIVRLTCITEANRLGTCESSSACTTCTAIPNR